MKNDGFVRYLAAVDFDQTAFDTFATEGQAVGVETACRKTCSLVLGLEASEIFNHQGGLNNRSPWEVVRDILTSGNTADLIGHAWRYFEAEKDGLEGYVPDGKGVKLEWIEDDQAIITELFVRTKLKILMAQISSGGKGHVWPRPCKGFLPFWRSILDFNRKSERTGVKIQPAILSSGHDSLIDRCFETWGLPWPELKITDDTMRSPRCSAMSFEERTKPCKGPFRVLCEDWLNLEGGKMKERYADDPVSCVDGHGFYGGDCLVRDGGLARNLGLCFLWFNPERRHRGDFAGNLYSIEDWSTLSRSLFSDDGIMLLKSGAPFNQIAMEVLED